MFRDRADAGRALAGALGVLVRRPDVVVLGLARGGVPVARGVAAALGAPFDVLVARKLGVPGIEEVALGAIAEGSRQVARDPVAWYLGLPRRVVRRVAARERLEVERRVFLYRAGQSIPHLRSRTIVLVDDGLATGATLRAAVLAVRTHQPARVVVAVPVANAESAAALKADVDELVSLVTPKTFGTVSDWYEDFAPVTDADVLRLLGRDTCVAAGSPPSVANARLERAVAIPIDGCSIAGDIGPPDDAAGSPNEVRGLVVLAHGGGSSRNSFRNRYLAGRLRLAGFATLRLDLLTDVEQAADAECGEIRFDVAHIAQRLIAAIEWAAREKMPGADRIILIGASTGAAAALMAAAARPALISAIVARGGRVDLASAVLGRVKAPVLLVVGGDDWETLRWNTEAMQSLAAKARLVVIRGAGHTFEEPGALGAVGEQVVRWVDSRDARLYSALAGVSSSSVKLWWSRRRALRQSRCTVRSETPRRAAISANV